MAKGRAFHRPVAAAKPTEYKGVRYGSKAEASRAMVLDGLQAAGLVAWWLRQVPIDVGEPGIDKPYRIDFLVAESRADGTVRVHAEEVKGFDTASFRRHVKQWMRRGPMPLHVIRGKQLEIITPDPGPAEEETS